MILESRVPSDPGFFGEDMVVLQFEVRQDFLKAAGTDETREKGYDLDLLVLLVNGTTQGERGLPVFVVNVVPESFGVNQGHGDPDSILFEL